MIPSYVHLLLAMPRLRRSDDLGGALRQVAETFVSEQISVLLIFAFLAHQTLVTLDAVPAGIGTGTALLDALTTRLCAEGCKRLWLTMTNGNLSALQFYLRRGFRLTAVRLGAVEAARKLKPTIPLFGEHGIPLRDELDLCRILGTATEEVPVPPPWLQG